MMRWLLSAAFALALAGCGGCGTPDPDPDPTPELSPTLSTVEVSIPELAADGEAAATITVTLRDTEGQPMGGEAVELTATGEGNTLSASPQESNAEGVASFTLSSTRPGEKTISARVGEVELSQQPSITFVVGPPAKLAFRVQPSSAQAATALSPGPVVEVHDAAGNLVTRQSVTVKLGLAQHASNPTLNGVTQAATVDGVASFEGLTIATAGAGYALVASGTGLESATSAAFDITAGPPAALVFKVEPPGATAGQVLSPAVEVELRDAHNNRLLSSETVTLSISNGPPGATMSGTAAVSAAEGVARFGDLSFDKAGLYVLAATAPGFSGAASSSFTVGAGTATRLAFATQPQDVKVRQLFAVAVAVTDERGNRVNGATDAVTLSLVGSGSGVLRGTTTVQAAGGTASFSGLSVDEEGAGYTLVASSGTLTPATSGGFAVVDDVPPSGTTLTVSGSTQSTLSLRWLAVGDDGHAGTASAQELRYSTSPIVEANFAAGTQLTVGAPKAPGELEGATASGLQAATTYYFGLRIADGAGNTSFSTVSGTTAACPAGYTGAACDLCDTGYHETSPGVCEDACTNPDPCNPPPAATCNGDVALSHPAQRGCTPTTTAPYYTCQAATETDCSATGQLCLEGACVANPCDANPCTTPPAECNAQGELVTYTSTCTATPNGSTLTAVCASTPSAAECGASSACVGGACAPTAVPVPGELLITEVMYSSTSPLGQWFELYNLGQNLLDLTGLTAEAVGGQSFTVTSATPVLLPAGGRFVFGHTADPAQNGGAAVDYAYGALSPTFALETSKHLRLSAGAVVVEELDYGTVAPAAPVDTAVNLSSGALAAGANQRSWYWCPATASLSGGGKGTPGAANDACGLSVTAPVDWCVLQHPANAGLVEGSSPVATYARLWEPEVTTRNQNGNDHYPFLVAEVGYGRAPASGAPDTSTWTWTAAAPNPGYGPSSPGFDGNDDEVTADLSFAASGDYVFGYRMMLKDPVTGALSAATYCDTTGVAPSSPLYGTAQVVHPTGDLTAARAAADGTGLSLEVWGAYVTYVRPAIGGDPAGLFLQGEQDGPALFVKVDPATLSPVPARGDRVRLTVTGLSTYAELRQATSVSGYTQLSTGNSLTALGKDVSGATDVVSELASYESELITVTGTVTGAFGGAGTGFVSAPIATAGLPNANFHIRMPTTLRDSLELGSGCVLRVNDTPMWRFNTRAQATAWTASELTVLSCPAPKVLSATARSATEVVVTFDRQLDPASLDASGSQFTVAPALAVTAATLSGTSQVTLTTAAQTVGASYVVTVAGTVRDLVGTAVAAPDDDASFDGFDPAGAACTPSQVVISQVYGGGSSGGATYKNDYVELHNRSTQPVTLNGWSLQYGSATGTGTWNVSALAPTVVLPPGGYYLVQQAGAPTGPPLPITPDETGSLGMSATTGKVALVRDTTALFGACPSGSQIVDLVGYGTANCSETSLAPAPSISTAVFRAADGCQDTTDNGADFTAATPVPRNSSSPAVSCGCF